MSRYWRRPATEAEVERALREHPSEDLAPPTGLFVVAAEWDAGVGCGGVRLLCDGVAELTRVYVAAPLRGRGLGARIVEHLEGEAVALGSSRMRLDTRSDLIEARGLYARLGYQEVPPFNDDPYVGHWFEKALSD